MDELDERARTVRPIEDGQESEYTCLFSYMDCLFMIKAIVQWNSASMRRSLENCALHTLLLRGRNPGDGDVVRRHAMANDTLERRRSKEEGRQTRRLQTDGSMAALP